MLLISFHGGSGGTTNVYAYDTTTGGLNSHHALQGVSLDGVELRDLIFANSFLYVVDGSKKSSRILCFTPPSPGASKYHFTYVGDFLDATYSKKGHFENSISHPYALCFDGQGNCYISNQDTNVVAQAQVACDFKTATLGKGCQSSYLNGVTSFCSSSGCVYLDGTFVASQNGTLPGVDVAATDVPAEFGGLSIAFADHKSKEKVQNSVRDVVIAGSVLFVCDEPSKVLRLYSLPAGTYLGASPALSASPTHLSIQPTGLYVSAGSDLYWSALPSSPTPGALAFSSVVTAPSGYKVGGITFNGSVTQFAFGLGLFGHSSLHGLGQFNIFDFHHRNFDSPGFGLLINDAL